MVEVLQRKDRKARKPHLCDYCYDTIEKGETYEWAQLKGEDRLYEWKNHKKCGFIANELWSYIDPDEGMTGDDFQDGVKEFCRTFVCPDCKDYDEVEDCTKDFSFCTDKVHDYLQTHEIYQQRRTGYYAIWQCRERTRQ